MDRKKYCVLRYRNNLDNKDFIEAYLSPEGKDYILCEQQDGQNWYCEKDECFFFMTNNLDDIVNCLREQYFIVDVRLGGLSQEDRKYIVEELNK